MPLAAIILIAFLLRFPSLDGNTQYVSSEFNRDIRAIKSLNDGALLSLGPKASLGEFHFGPAYYYLLYPLGLLFDFKIYSLALTAALFSTLTVLMSFFIARAWWQNTGLAHLISFFLAISALDIQFAKYASNPNLIPFFALLFFYCAQKIISGSFGKPHVVGAGLAIGIAMQLHVVPLVSLPLIVLVLVIFRRWRLPFAGWVYFLGTAVLVNAPYLHYELVHNFENFRGLMHISQSAAYYGNLQTHLLEYFRFWFSTWISIHHLFSVVLLGGFWLVYPITGNVILLYATYLYNRMHLTRFSSISLQTPASVKLTLWLWFLVPTIFLIGAPGNVNQLLIYYFTMFLPLTALLLGLWIYRLCAGRLRTTAIAMAVSYAVWQIVQIVLYNIHYPMW